MKISIENYFRKQYLFFNNHKAFVLSTLHKRGLVIFPKSIHKLKLIN
jgi:hypothetical protein